MTSSRSTFQHRSPSSWHDDTMSRDAGHDALQIEVWKTLRNKVPRTILFGTNYQNEKVEFIRTSVHFEYPLFLDGRIVGWGDVVELYKATVPNGSGTVERHYIRVYEIKPKIYSVGGLVRQLTSLRILVNKVAESRGMGSGGDVMPVVYEDDPKLDMLSLVSGSNRIYAIDRKSTP